VYSKTMPVIEVSEDLTFAPWTASYPHCTSQFEAVGFDVSRNFWNSVYDVSGEMASAHWRIAPLGELLELSVCLDDDPAMVARASNPCSEVTQDVLCAEPLEVDALQPLSACHAASRARPAPPGAPSVGQPKVVMAVDSPTKGAVGFDRLALLGIRIISAEA